MGKGQAPTALQAAVLVCMPTQQLMLLCKHAHQEQLCKRAQQNNNKSYHARLHGSCACLHITKSNGK